MANNNKTLTLNERIDNLWAHPSPEIENLLAELQPVRIGGYDPLLEEYANPDQDWQRYYSIIYVKVGGLDNLVVLPGAYPDPTRSFYLLIGKPADCEIRWFANKDDAREYAISGETLPGEDDLEEIDSISSYCKNQYEEDVLEEEYTLFRDKRTGGFYVGHQSLQCRSSAGLGLGTCGCHSHKPYSYKEWKLQSIDDWSKIISQFKE